MDTVFAAQTDEQAKPRFVSVTDTARILGIGATKTYSLLNAGELTGVNIGRRRLICLDSLDAYIERLTCTAMGGQGA